MPIYLKVLNLSFSVLHSRAAGVVEADDKYVIYLTAKLCLFFSPVNPFRAIALATTYNHWPRTGAWHMRSQRYKGSLSLPRTDHWALLSTANTTVQHKLHIKVKFSHCGTKFLKSGNPKVFNLYKGTWWCTTLEMRFLQFFQDFGEVHLNWIYYLLTSDSINFP